MKPHPFLRFILSLGALLFAGAVPAAEKTGAALDSRAEQLIRKAADQIKNARSLSVELDLAMSMQMRSMKQQMSSLYSIALQRPNRYAMVLKDGTVGGTMVTDGRKLFTYLPMLKQYTEAAAPGNLEDLSDESEAMMVTGGGSGGFFNSLFLAKDPFVAMLEGTTNVQIAGTEKIDGHDCQRVRLLQEGCAWDLWIDSGEQPLIRKIFSDLGAMMRAMAGKQDGGDEATDALKEMKMEATMTFKNWALNPDLKPATFAFTPPEGANRVEAFLGESPDEEPGQQLAGKPAPAFKLELLGGGTFDLASQKGKSIVVLDFWATWCGPCVRAMPTLIEVTGALKDKGVVFVAVNQDEETDVIQDFLKKKKLNPVVALDKGSKVGDLYGVTGIPQTVIIDKQGVVQTIHVGLLPNLKQKLTEEL